MLSGYLSPGLIQCLVGLGLADCILFIGLMPRQLILVRIQGTASIKVWSVCTEVSQLGCIHGKSK